MLSIQDMAALENMLFIVFSCGIFTGAICTGVFKALISLVDLHYKFPRRIKTDSGYLYRFKNKYVTLDQRNELRSQVIQKYNIARIKENL